MPQTDQQKIIEIKVRMDDAVQGIAKYTQYINQLRDAQAKLKDELKQGTISQQQYSTAMAQTREQIKSYQNNIRALSREYQNSAREQRENEGSLVSLRAQLSKLTATYDQLSREMRQGDFGENMRKQIMEVSQELKEAEAETNRFYRNVGNYTGATNYLNTSVQQLVRELPSAAYGVNILISALSNNIGQLTDAIELSKKANAELKAQNKSTIPVWRQVLSSVVSWQTALMVGVTLLTMYGDKVIKWIGSLFQSKEAIDANKTAQETMHEAMIKGSQSAAQETVSLRTLYMTAQDTTQAMQTRISAVDELQRKYPGYFGNMSQEAILAGKASEAYRQLTDDILATAQARAYENKIAELTEKNIDIQDKIDEQTKYLNDNEKAYNSALKASRTYYGTSTAGVGVYINANKELTDTFEETQEALKDNKAELDANNAAISRMEDRVLKLQEARHRLNNGKNNNEQQETTAKKAARLRAEANKKALEEQQKADELLNKLIENNMERRRAEIATQYDNEIATLKNRLETEKNLNDDARKAMNSQIVSLEKIKNQELAKLDEEAIRAEVERETQRLAWLLEAAGEDYRKRRDIKLRQLEDEEKLEEARIKVEVTDEKERQAQLDALHQAFNARRKAVTDEYVKNTTDAQVKGITEEFTRQINSLGYDTSADIELKKAELELNKWLKIRANARQEDGESAEAYAKRLQEIDAQVTAAQQKYNQAQIHAEKTKWDTISSLTNSAAQLIKNFGNESKAMTALAKTLALATVAINTGKAISEAIAANAGKPWGFATIATVIAQILSAMTSATSIINSAKFATGGLVTGPGTGTSDSIPAMLSNGESVMTARATGMFAPLLSTLNQLGGGVPITVSEPTPTLGEEFLAAAIAKGMERMPRPVVSVEEINKVSKRVEVIERMGSV